MTGLSYAAAHTFERKTFERNSLTIWKEDNKSYELRLRTPLYTAAADFGFLTTILGVTSWGMDATNGNMAGTILGSYYIELEKEGRPVTQSERIRLQLLRFVVHNQE